MTILIVDDTPMARKLLKMQLIKSGESEDEISEANNVDDFLKLVEQKPDIVFLDLHLGAHHAFEALRAVSKRSFELIITTGHPEYAIQSYEHGAIGYLSKPISDLQLRETLLRAKKRIQEKIKNKHNETLLMNVTDFPVPGKRIILKTNEQIYHKRVNEILYIEGDNDKQFFYLLDGTQIKVSATMKDYEEELSTFGFYRIHNQYIVNLKFVESYITTTAEVRLTNTRRLPVSRNRKDGFLEALYASSIRLSNPG